MLSRAGGARGDVGAAAAPRLGVAGLPAAASRRREAFAARPAAYEPSSASWYEPAEAGGGDAAAAPPPGEPAFAGIAWVQEQGDLIIEQTRIEEEEAARAKLLGLDVRAQGSSQREAATVDETDEARHYWHRRLKACADAGDYVQAQRVLADMRQQGLPPGPRAYHALIFAFVKGSNPAGALEAIRLEVNAGLQPLPQSYTAIIHGFLREGDTAKAENMYASNRRAGVPCDASWSAICAALFRMGSHERGATLLEQGEAEGMRPDKALYSALIKHMCRNDQLGAATARLEEMQERGLAPDKDHLSPLVTAHALAGEVEEAEALLARLLKAPGPTTAAAIGACNALLQAYLSLGYERDDFAQIFASLRQLMAKAGMALDRKGYALHLEAGLALEDLQVSLLAFRSLKNKGQGCLEYVDDEMLAELLRQLSFNDMPMGVFEVLATMNQEQRQVLAAALEPDDAGRTFITAWLNNRLSALADGPGAEDAEEDKPSEYIVIDDVTLDPVTLCAVSVEGKMLAPTKMSVKELRAELAARQCPLQGNKKELLKQLQKARLEAAVPGEAGPRTKKAAAAPVEVVVAVDDAEEEDDEEMMVRKVDDEDDEDEDDWEYDSMMYNVLRSKVNGLQFDQSFVSSSAGAKEALDLCDGAIECGAVPSVADIAIMATAVGITADDEVRESLAVRLMGVADTMPASDAAVAKEHIVTALAEAQAAHDALKAQLAELADASWLPA